MTSIELGRAPDKLVVRLVRSDAFVVVLKRYDKPAGQPGRAAVDWTDPPVLEFPNAGVSSWTAALAGNEATFNVAAAAVDALVATDKEATNLTVGGVVWARGKWLAY